MYITSSLDALLFAIWGKLLTLLNLDVFACNKHGANSTHSIGLSWSFNEIRHEKVSSLCLTHNKPSNMNSYWKQSHEGVEVLGSHLFSWYLNTHQPKMEWLPRAGGSQGPKLKPRWGCVLGRETRLFQRGGKYGRKARTKRASKSRRRKAKNMTLG